MCAKAWRGSGLLTGPVGVKGGEVNCGVGSRVERAEAPVSPRSSSPTLVDPRRIKGIFGQSRSL